MSTVADVPIHRLQLDCGLDVAIERSQSLRSCGTVLRLPGGFGADPAGAAGEGAATLLAELVQRGAGERSSRAFADAIDSLGASTSVSAGAESTLIEASCLGEHLRELLPLLFDVARCPRIEDAEVEPTRSLALQELESVNDVPPTLGSLEFRRLLAPAPFNRTGLGDPAGLAVWDGSSLRSRWSERTGPRGALLTVAGGVDPAEVVDLAEELVAGWIGECVGPMQEAPPIRGRSHLQHPAAQTFMMIGADGITGRDPDLIALKMLSYILGGSSSSRLFTEVRERRGLCYGIGMGVQASPSHGFMQVYAASTPARAPETLRQIREELAKASLGVTEEEFEIARTGFKSSIVFSGESSAARAGSLAIDIVRGIEPRSLAEIAAEVDALSHEQLNDVAARRMDGSWLDGLTVVTVGPEDPFAGADLGWPRSILSGP